MGQGFCRRGKGGAIEGWWRADLEAEGAVWVGGGRGGRRPGVVGELYCYGTPGYDGVLWTGAEGSYACGRGGSPAAAGAGGQGRCVREGSVWQVLGVRGERGLCGGGAVRIWTGGQRVPLRPANCALQHGDTMPCRGVNDWGGADERCG